VRVCSIEFTVSFKDYPFRYVVGWCHYYDRLTGVIQRQAGGHIIISIDKDGSVECSVDDGVIIKYHFEGVLRINRADTDGKRKVYNTPYKDRGKEGISVQPCLQ